MRPRRTVPPSSVKRMKSKDAATVAAVVKHPRQSVSVINSGEKTLDQAEMHRCRPQWRHQTNTVTPRRMGCSLGKPLLLGGGVCLAFLGCNRRSRLALQMRVRLRLPALASSRLMLTCIWTCLPIRSCTPLAFRCISRCGCIEFFEVCVRDGHAWPVVWSHVRPTVR